MQPEYRIKCRDLRIDHMSWVPSNEIVNPIVDVFNVVCSIGKSTRTFCARKRRVVGRRGQKLVCQCENPVILVSRERLSHVRQVLRRGISQ
jgi:hypothetical protein